MIKFSRIAKPAELTDKKVEKLTNTFKVSGSSVWGKLYITKGLSDMSNNKCCYCECKLGKESNYLEVEHFKPKLLYPDLVVVWSNLLPSCRHCNGQKGEHDTVTDPIIDPTVINPKEHIVIRAYRMYPRNGSVLGKMTIKVTDTNNRARLVNVRADIGYHLHEELEKLVKVKDDYIKEPTGNEKLNFKRELNNGIKNLLSECQPESEYSATAATEMLGDDSYRIIKEAMIREKIWTDELQRLHDGAEIIELS